MTEALLREKTHLFDRVYEILWSKTYVARLKVRQLHHREIVAAIAARDTAKAMKLMQDHVRETAADLLPKAFGEVAQ
jgi:DNA-binding GntR family transcriptional regulator